MSYRKVHLPPPVQKLVNFWQIHQGSTIAGIFCLGLDLLSKAWARHALPIGESQPFFPPLIKFSLVMNTGAAFSLGRDNGQVVLITATIVFVLLLFWYRSRLTRGFESWLEEYGLAIMIGAALGNLLDRYFFGHVTDFLEFTFINFPVFNCADVMIDVGIGMIILSTLKPTLKRSNDRLDQSSGQ